LAMRSCIELSRIQWLLRPRRSVLFRLLPILRNQTGRRRFLTSLSAEAECWTDEGTAFELLAL